MREDAPATARSGVRRWLLSCVRDAALWKTPRSPRALILSVEMLCVTWLAVANFVIVPDSADLRRFALLFFLGALYAEGGDRVERLRRFAGYVDNSVIVEGSTQWCVAAALVLPPGLAGLFAVLVYGHTLVRSRRHRTQPPHRTIYSGATATAAALVGSTIITEFGVARGDIGTSLWSLLAVVTAVVTYTLVQESLIVAVLWLIRRPAPLRALLTGPTERAMEYATLALGVLLAVAVLHAPYLSPVVVLIVIVLRRSALVHELQVQATRDAKTGLLNAGAWRHEAERELVRAERIDSPVTVFMIDLDHFKNLNDAHGHQAGDAALKLVADCISDALRGYDAVGRFGGEEFIALLADIDAQQADRVANRLVERIRMLRLDHDGSVTASIGVGIGRSSAHTLDDLISVADQALYVAKDSGRDRVHVLHAVLDPHPPARSLDDPVIDF
jgi:diguanylate cyclase (GGDEF)-like protein